MSGVVARRGTWFRRGGRSGRYRLGARHVYTGRHGRSTLSMAGAGRTPPRGQTIRARVAGVGARTGSVYKGIVLDIEGGGPGPLHDSPNSHAIVRQWKDPR